MKIRKWIFYVAACPWIVAPGRTNTPRVLDQLRTHDHVSRVITACPCLISQNTMHAIQFRIAAISLQHRLNKDRKLGGIERAVHGCPSAASFRPTHSNNAWCIRARAL